VDAKNDTHNAAVCLARCMRLVQQDKALSSEQRQGLIQKYGARAVELLRQAVANGFADGQALRSNTVLEPLRERSDYRELVAGLR
jgi:hypothetical protein